MSDLCEHGLVPAKCAECCDSLVEEEVEDDSVWDEDLDEDEDEDYDDGEDYVWKTARTVQNRDVGGATDGMGNVYSDADPGL